MILLLALLAGLILYLRPEWGGWPLLPVGIFWLHQWRQGKPVFQRTPLDGWMLMFGLTAVIGVTTAFDYGRAWLKFWVLLDGILIFYALVRQSRRDAWRVACYLSLIAVAIVGYFLMTHNWQTMPADIGLLDRAGKWWMGLRPNLPVRPLPANMAAGLLIMIYPFQVALAHYGRRIKRTFYVQMALLTGTLTLFGLFLTSSRAAWVALGIALTVWGLGAAGQSLSLPRRVWLIVGFGVGAVALASFLLLDGMPSAMVLSQRVVANNRTGLIQATADLAADFALSGAGLATFDGLYSQYVAVLPFFVFNYGHNFWLDVWLEQGVLGVVSLLGMFALSLFMLFRARRESRLPESETESGALEPHLGLFRWGVFTSIVAVLLHGLIDDALYGYLASPLLLLLPGLTMMITIRRGQKLPPIVAMSVQQRRVVLVALAVIVVATGIWQQRPLRAMWLANTGAVAMARVQLQDFPTGRWDDGRYQSLLQPLVAQFETAVALVPTQRTAHHRLGLIAMGAQDYETAVAHLEIAYQLDPGHRGITKSLGYAYVWTGQLAAAQTVLTNIPEAEKEMREYQNWWTHQKQPELADKAAQFTALSD